MSATIHLSYDEQVSNGDDVETSVGALRIWKIFVVCNLKQLQGTYHFVLILAAPVEKIGCVFTSSIWLARRYVFEQLIFNNISLMQTDVFNTNIYYSAAETSPQQIHYLFLFI